MEDKADDCAAEILEAFRKTRRSNADAERFFRMAFVEGWRAATGSTYKAATERDGGKTTLDVLGLVPMVLRLDRDLEPPGWIHVRSEDGSVDVRLERANEPELWEWMPEPRVYVHGGFDHQAGKLVIEPHIAEGREW